MSYTFLQMQDAVILDAFDEDDRPTVKNALNHRYGMMCNHAEWTFMQDTDTVTVTSGSQTVTGLPSDLGIVLRLQRADGTPLEALEEYRDFAGRYIGTDNTYTGKPEAFTVLGGAVFVGPTSSETSTAYLLVHEQAFTPMSADADVPVIPAEHQMGLVFGAKADLFALKSILLGDTFEKLFMDELAAMGRRYLVTVRGAAQQRPAYRPGR